LNWFVEAFTESEDLINKSYKRRRGEERRGEGEGGRRGERKYL
jgi:hypothetical protein